MDYNNFELYILNDIRKKKYQNLKDWEKFLVKENVKLHRNAKKIRENEVLMDGLMVDQISFNG
ncbi:hypothetical protein ABEX78_32200 [Priestia megaterium]